METVVYCLKQWSIVFPPQIFSSREPGSKRPFSTLLKSQKDIKQGGGA